MISLEPLGDRAFLANFGTELEASAWVSSVRSQGWTGVLDVVLAYRTAAVYADPDQADLDQLEEKLRAQNPVTDEAAPGKLIKVPVLYDGDDLPEVANRLELTEPEVIALHSETEYHVYAIGFLPGFPYAGYLPDRLCGLPRRQEPRLKVPAGSVAIVGKQTAIYPSSSPGGWQLIGRTPLRIVDLERGEFPIRAGDRLRFEPIDAREFASRQGDQL